MIIEKLANLDKPKRISAAIFTMLLVAGICYYTIPGEFVMKLWSSKARLNKIQTIFARTQRYDTDYSRLQKQCEEIQDQLDKQRRMFFSNKQAFAFFENIEMLAQAHNLRLISRVISKPEAIIISEETEEKSEAQPQQQFLKKQSANVIVAGNYFDIVEFVNELSDRLQRVHITNLTIALPTGAKFNPNASFDATLLTYMAEEVEK